MTVSEFLEVVRRSFDSVEVAYLHPTLYIFCLDDVFQGRDDEYKKIVFLDKTKLEDNAVERIVSFFGVDVILCSEKERDSDFDFVPKHSESNHWLPLVDEETRSYWRVNSGPVRAIHFYGYKGGQARSSILGMMAKQAADDGLKVLVVDADLEAPSLSSMFGIPVTNPKNTLLGLCTSDVEPESLRVYQSTISQGNVELIAARPIDSRFDIDYSCFIVQSAVNLDILSFGVDKIKKLAEKDDVDLVFFDHRTGLSASVLPIISQWAGSVVVAARTDGLSMEGAYIYSTLFQSYPEAPGVFVSFSLDPEESLKSNSEHLEEIESLLQPLGDALSQSAEQSGDDESFVPLEALYSYWISWYHDRAFLKHKLPELEDISKDNLQNLRDIRDALELGKSSSRSEYPQPVSSPSGAEDEGLFLETPHVSKVYSKNSPYTYILGRKGTGKTRIFTELISAGFGLPLFSTPDMQQVPSIKSNSALCDKIFRVVKDDYELFWWSLIWINLQVGSNRTDDDLEAAIDGWINLSSHDRHEKCSSIGVVDYLKNESISDNLIYLIDGVETAVGASELSAFVESLFRVLATVQYDRMLSRRLKIRLFLRSDLMSASSQNLEQQTANRTIELVWDQDSIFNFLLARIESNSWFQEMFEKTCGKIHDKLILIKRGGLKEEEYKDLILDIFPEKLRRNNIQTFTFLRTYFSDAGGESDKRTMFYPRLFENFIRALTDRASTYGDQAIEGGRVRHDLVLDAHKTASEKFLREIKQELYISLNFDRDRKVNESKIDGFISAFEGLSTPFYVEDIIGDLHQRTNEERGQIRVALNKLKELGFFEERPGHNRQWRSGQLYKSALGMKYERTRRPTNSRNEK